MTAETEELGSVSVLENLFPPKKSVLSQAIEAGLALEERLQRTDRGWCLPFLLSFILLSHLSSL